MVAGAGNPPSERDGLGATTSLTLAAHGAKVISVSHVAENCETVTSKIKAAGGQATLVPCDLTNFEAIDTLGPALIERFEKLDIFVGNAGALGIAQAAVVVADTVSQKSL